MNRELNVLQAAAHVGMEIAKFGAVAVFLISMLGLWVGTPQ